MTNGTYAVGDSQITYSYPFFQPPDETNKFVSFHTEVGVCDRLIKKRRKEPLVNETTILLSNRTITRETTRVGVNSGAGH